MNTVSSAQKREMFFNEVFPNYYGFILSRSIYVITKLQVAQLLSKHGPLTGSECAQKLGINHASKLERLLNFLASSHIFTKGDDRRFSLSTLSQDLLNEATVRRIISHHDHHWNGELDEEDEATSPIEGLARLYMLAKAIHTACRQNLFETPEAIDGALKVHLERADLIKGGRLSEKGELFLDKSLRAFVLHDSEARWKALGGLEEAVTDGIVPFEENEKMAYFDYLKFHLEEEALFSEAMSFISGHEYARLVARCKELISPGDTVIDVGGGKGLYLQEILKANPEVKGILFDLPDTVKQHILSDDTLARCEVVGGSFFESVPQADIYLFKRVLHDWSDEAAINILKKCRESAHPGSRLVLHEMMLPQPEALMMDVYSMTLLEGQQRTVENFERILNESGWKVKSVSPTGCFISELVAGV